MKALSIPQVLSAFSKALENAQELIEDAELLLENNRYPRAFALAHLASEELIKSQLLFPVALVLARDRPVDWKKIHRVLRNHQVKIEGIILLDFVFEPPSDGIYQASKLSQRMRAVRDINNRKNYSLYASQVDHEYFKPSELIDDQAAIACVSDARGLLQEFQMFYSGMSTLMGMTEEGLRRCIAMPAFQLLLQALGDKADLSHFPAIDEQQAVVGLTAFLNNPTLQAALAQFPSLIEQDLQSLNRSHNDDPQTADRISDYNQEDTLKGVAAMSNQGDITAAVARIHSRLDTLASINEANILIPGGSQSRYHQVVEEAYAALGLIETQIYELRTELEYQHKRLDEIRDAALAQETGQQS